MPSEGSTLVHGVWECICLIPWSLLLGSMSLGMNQPASQAAMQPARQSASQSAWLTERLQLESWSVFVLPDLAGMLVGWLDGWLASWLASWLAGWLVGPCRVHSWKTGVKCPKKLQTVRPLLWFYSSLYLWSQWSVWSHWSSETFPGELFSSGISRLTTRKRFLLRGKL